MSNETSKASKLATRQALYDRFLVRTGYDLGCGQDILLSTANRTVFGLDKEDGDLGNWKGPDDSLDGPCCEFIYSSHMAEHLHDLPRALQNWESALHVGGVIFLVVPDFLLYERLQWPSLFNADHKAAFSLFAIDPSRRPEKFYGYAEMVEIGKVAGLELVHAEIECHGYDFQALPYLQMDQTAGNACANVIWIYRKL